MVHANIHYSENAVWKQILNKLENLQGQALKICFWNYNFNFFYIFCLRFISRWWCSCFYTLLSFLCCYFFVTVFWFLSCFLLLMLPILRIVCMYRVVYGFNLIFFSDISIWNGRVENVNLTCWRGGASEMEWEREWERGAVNFVVLYTLHRAELLFSEPTAELMRGKAESFFIVQTQSLKICSWL